MYPPRVCAARKVASQWYMVSASMVRVDGNNSKNSEILTHFRHNPMACQR